MQSQYHVTSLKYKCKISEAKLTRIHTFYEFIPYGKKFIPMFYLGPRLPVHENTGLVTGLFYLFLGTLSKRLR